MHASDGVTPVFAAVTGNGDPFNGLSAGVFSTPSFADWDGDGLPDIVYNSILGRVKWLKNIGTRTAPKLAAAQPIEVEWDGAQPNHLKVTEYGKPPVIYTRGGFGNGPSATRVTRMPAGLPEGYFECFANIYLDAAELIRAAIEKRPPDPEATVVPQAEEGTDAVRFVDAVIASGRTSTWVDL